MKTIFLDKSWLFEFVWIQWHHKFSYDLHGYSLNVQVALPSFKSSRPVVKLQRLVFEKMHILSHRIHVWYIYLHLPYFTIQNNQL